MADGVERTGWQGRALASAAITSAGALLAALLLGGVPRFGIDDANIIHVYARHIAGGLGSVYYPGGPFVEGSTSSLWTLIVAALWRIAGDAAVAHYALSILLAWAVVFQTMRLWDDVRDPQDEEGPAMLAIGVGYLSAPVAFSWLCWSLMDVTLWVLLVVVSVRAAIACSSSRSGGGWRFALALGLLTLCRPEGVALALGLSGVAAVMAWLAGTPERRMRALWSPLLAGGAALAVCAAATAIRLKLFGQPFPNTFYAKVSHDIGARLSDGAGYLVVSAFALPAVAIGCAALGWRIVADGRPVRHGLVRLCRERPGVMVLAAALAGVMLVVVLTGGDHFAGQRFLQPALPLAIVGVALGAAALLRGGRVRAGPMLLAGVAGALAMNVAFARNHAGVLSEYQLADWGRDFGSRLNRVAEGREPTSIGVLAAGGVALTYRGGPIYDLLGLNWTRMARSDVRRSGEKGHDAFDPAIFYDAAPDIVLSGALSDPRGGAVWIGQLEDRAFKGELRSDRFRRLYVLAAISGASETRYVFVRRKWLAAAPANAHLRLLDWGMLNILPGAGPA